MNWPFGFTWLMAIWVRRATPEQLITLSVWLKEKAKDKVIEEIIGELNAL
jgi:hypothetical protein